MFIILGIVVVLISVLLIFIVLIQNPKGGVLSSTFGSMGNQILGANRSTDVVEKITWYLAGGLMVLSILSIFILPSGTDASVSGTEVKSDLEEALKNKKSTAPMLPTAPVSSAPAPSAPVVEQEASTSVAPTSAPAPAK